MGMIGNTLAQGLISGANIVDGTVDTPDLKDGAVTTAKIVDANVTTAKIADSAVTAAKIATGVVTPGKLSTGALTWDSSGNHGIGVTPDNTMLHVKGNWVSGHSTVKSQTVLSFSSGGSTGYGMYDSDGTRCAFVSADSSAFQLYGQANRPMWFSTNSAYRMQVTSGGRFEFTTTGSFTTTPLTNFHIKADWISGYGAAGIQAVTTGAATGLSLFNAAGTRMGYFNVDTNTGQMAVGNNSNAALVFETNNAERGRFTPSGNLSLGSGSDNGPRLSVDGNSLSVSGVLYRFGDQYTQRMGGYNSQAGNNGRTLFAYAYDQANWSYHYIKVIVKRGYYYESGYAEYMINCQNGTVTQVSNTNSGTSTSSFSLSNNTVNSNRRITSVSFVSPASYQTWDFEIEFWGMAPVSWTSTPANGQIALG